MAVICLKLCCAYANEVNQVFFFLSIFGIVIVVVTLKFFSFISFCCTSTLHILQKLPTSISVQLLHSIPQHECNEGNKSQEEIEIHERKKKKKTRVSKQKKVLVQSSYFDHIFSLQLCYVAINTIVKTENE